MSKAATARSKFAELRALRESGRKRLDTYEVHQEADLYEEVDEDGYKKVVRDRLNQDDFVIDDNGEGYADDGREEWDRRTGYDTESEEDLPTKGKNAKACKLYSNLVLKSYSQFTQLNGSGKMIRQKKRTLRRVSATILLRGQSQFNRKPE
jgi:hypothetical protein